MPALPCIPGFKLAMRVLRRAENDRCNCPQPFDVLFSAKIFQRRWPPSHLATHQPTTNLCQNVISGRIFCWLREGGVHGMTEASLTRAMTTEVFDHDQHTKASPVDKLVGDEVEAPALVGFLSHVHWRPRSQCACAPHAGAPSAAPHDRSGTASYSSARHRPAAAGYEAADSPTDGVDPPRSSGAPGSSRRRTHHSSDNSARSASRGNKLRPRQSAPDAGRR